MKSYFIDLVPHQYFQHIKHVLKSWDATNFIKKKTVAWKCRVLPQLGKARSRLKLGSTHQGQPSSLTLMPQHSSSPGEVYFSPKGEAFLRPPGGGAPRMCQQRAEYVVPCSPQSQCPDPWSAPLRCAHWMPILGDPGAHEMGVVQGGGQPRVGQD